MARTKLRTSEKQCDISASVPKKKRDNIFRDIARNPMSYILALPAVIYVLLFGYFTYPYMIIAFEKFNYQKGIWNSPFVGFQNFEFFFQSNDALRVTFNTLWLNILFLIFTTVASVAIALVLNELSSRWFKRVTQSFMLLPYYISWVVVSYVLYSIFSMDYGVLDQILRALHMQPVNWYTDANAWPAILTAMRVWKTSGMNAIIFLAAITGIDGSIYEAAQIDGANRWQLCTQVTLPLIMPTIVILTLLSIGRIMFGDFGMIYALIGDNGTLYKTTDIIDTYIFRALRETGDPSQAMAIGLFQSVIGFAMVFGSDWLTRKLYPEGAIY